ncbi:MAG: hypothetical protein M3R22_04235, partial [Pseudomonadota bacterium]|nr:hypothetical protein [Pseudomonadota bacterium]
MKPDSDTRGALAAPRAEQGAQGASVVSASRSGAFRSLRIRNYRIWVAGTFVSNIGTWTQRTAQDW